MHDIYREQRLAQEDGYNSRRFYAIRNGKRIPCRWEDAYMGLVEVEGHGRVWLDALAAVVEGVEPRGDER